MTFLNLIYCFCGGKIIVLFQRELPKPLQVCSNRGVFFFNPGNFAVSGSQPEIVVFSVFYVGGLEGLQRKLLPLQNKGERACKENRGNGKLYSSKHRQIF